MGTKQFDNYADLITFTRASGATYLDSDGVLKTASTNIPRIEYDADGNWLGLLVEEQRTNLVAYSSEFDNAAWTLGSNATLTADYAAAPDGQLTADRLQLPALSTTFLAEDFNFTSGQVYTFSVWVKATSGTSQFDLYEQTGGAGLQLGTQTATSEWQRFSYTFTASASGFVNFGINNGDDTYASDILIWGAQLEEGAFPTSYIPTSGSTATRAADVASIPTSAFGYNQEAGTVVCEFQTAVPLGVRGNEGIFSIEEDADNLHRVYLPASDALNWQFKSGGSSVFADAVGASFAPNVFSKAAIAFESGSQVSSLNGAAITAHGTSTASQPNATTLKIGYINTADMLGGHIKSIKYYPRRLTNAQLVELTQ